MNEVPDKYKNSQRNFGNPKAFVVEENTKRLFPDSYMNNNKEENKILVQKPNVGLTGRAHFKVPKTDATLDNVNGIFKSRRNRSAEAEELTPKVKYDDFQEFSNTARKVCVERQKYY
ncbi:MAG: hypothetical protein MJ252_20235 [archaeon]|nr:hypothetical protein [archaeon]